jgi:tRNA G10  N-methylase Trm11
MIKHVHVENLADIQAASAFAEFDGKRKPYFVAGTVSPRTSLLKSLL